MILEFLQYITNEKRYSLHTVESYQHDLFSFQEYLTQQFSISIIDANYQSIRSWVVFLKEEKFSNRSINRKITSLRSYFKFEIAKGQLYDNPAKRISLLKQERNLPNFVEESAMKLLFMDFENLVEYDEIIASTIFELFYATGIRVSELTNLKYEDVNHSKQTIKVIGKRNKERIIPFTRRLEAIFVKYQVARNEEIIEIVDSDYYFLTSKGKKLYNKFVYNIISYYLSRVTTAKKKSPHVLRHTFATHLLNKGADMNLIKEILGHSSLAATQVYTHNTIEKLKEVYKQAHPKA